MSTLPLPGRIVGRLPPQVDLDAAATVYWTLHHRWGPNCITSHHAVDSLAHNIAVLGIYQRLYDQLQDPARQTRMQRIMRCHELMRRRNVRLLDQWERDRIRRAKVVSDVGYRSRSCSRATLPPPLSDVG